jgi:phosphoenolpyruvate carboxylase
VGTALKKLKDEDPENYKIFKERTQHDAFIRYVMTNVDTSLAATDDEVMKMYISLVTKDDVREKFSNLFLSELQLTKDMMMDLLEQGIEERRKNHHYSNMLRSSLMFHLHKRQVDLLGRWREQKKNNDPQTQITQMKLMLTINGIASAMRNTG